MAQVKDFSIQEKLVSLVTLQQIDSKLDEIKILKGELPMEVADLEDEITGLHARLTRIEEEINGSPNLLSSASWPSRLPRRRWPSTKSKVRT